MAQPLATAGLSKNNKADGASSNAAMQRVFQLETKREKNRTIGQKKQKKLNAPSDISETDLQPLTGKNREDVIGELSKILITIQEIEADDGEDETTNLCKMMLSEHIRRLMLVQGTEVVSDGLKGYA